MPIELYTAVKEETAVAEMLSKIIDWAMCTYCCDKIEQLTHEIGKLEKAEKREERIAPTNIKKARVHFNFKLRPSRSHKLHVGRVKLSQLCL